ncbi:MAG: hypothetical protein HC930_15940 [Hydrococcus sp. SU_1_0]|nr:hypothetical protein [Hydrococcus sp. SU_1_0]
MMKYPKLNLQDYRNKIKLFNIKIALQTPQQNFSPSELLDIGKMIPVDLKIISKLSGINGDDADWYLVEASGAFTDLSITIACWQKLGVQKYLTIPSA